MIRSGLIEIMFQLLLVHSKDEELYARIVESISAVLWHSEAKSTLVSTQTIHKLSLRMQEDIRESANLDQKSTCQLLGAIFTKFLNATESYAVFKKLHSSISSSLESRQTEPVNILMISVLAVADKSGEKFTEYLTDGNFLKKLITSLSNSIEICHVQSSLVSITATAYIYIHLFEQLRAKATCNLACQALCGAAYRSLLCCIQAMVDPVWPAYTKQEIVVPIFEALVSSGSISGSHFYRLPWFKIILNKAFAHVSKLCPAGSEFRTVENLSVWFSFLTIVLNSGRENLREIFTDENLYQIKDLTKQAISLTELFPKVLEFWRSAASFLQLKGLSSSVFLKK